MIVFILYYCCVIAATYVDLETGNADIETVGT